MARGVLLSYIHTPVGDVAEKIELLRADVRDLRLASQREERHRRWATYATIAGAVFAAARLGVIWVPFIRERRRRRQ